MAEGCASVRCSRGSARGWALSNLLECERERAEDAEGVVRHVVRQQPLLVHVEVECRDRLELLLRQGVQVAPPASRHRVNGHNHRWWIGPRRRWWRVLEALAVVLPHDDVDAQHARDRLERNLPKKLDTHASTLSLRAHKCAHPQHTRGAGLAVAQKDYKYKHRSGVLARAHTLSPWRLPPRRPMS